MGKGEIGHLGSGLAHVVQTLGKLGDTPDMAAAAEFGSEEDF